MVKTGVYTSKKKDGTTYYRASFTYKGKHISLGSYSLQEEAHQAYLDAKKVVESSEITINDYNYCIGWSCE